MNFKRNSMNEQFTKKCKYRKIAQKISSLEQTEAEMTKELCRERVKETWFC